MAVGDYADTSGAVHAYAEQWSGGPARIVPTATVHGAVTSSFNSVRCTAASQCVAVGVYYTTNPATGRALTLAESWNGSSWSVVSTSSPARSTGTWFNSVSCAGPAFCQVVGTYLPNAAPQATLAELSKGTGWRLAPTPALPGSSQSVLVGIDCRTPSACEAAGFSVASGIPVTLTEARDGAVWHVVPSPNPPNTFGSRLLSPACIDPGHCVAVGYYRSSLVGIRTLAESWNGSKWAIVASPNVGADSALNTVACVTSSDCNAVGSATGTTLAEHWDGIKWRLVPTANP
jgi:hypothetical protein